MKKLGMIGGTGPESTIEYYRRIETDVQERTGHFPELVIESLSVFDVLEFCRKQDYDGLAEYLLKGVHVLADAGTDFACLTGMTPHIIFDRIREASPIPVISMIDTACEEAKGLGFENVALMGTYPTMSGTFFRKPFEQEGINVIVPAEDEMRFIEDKIETELEFGQVIPETRERLSKIAGRMVKENGAQAVVLGCTELPLILNEKCAGVPCLDVMQIHIRKLVSLIIDV